MLVNESEHCFLLLIGFSYQLDSLITSYLAYITTTVLMHVFNYHKISYNLHFIEASLLFRSFILFIIVSKTIIKQIHDYL